MAADRSGHGAVGVAVATAATTAAAVGRGLHWPQNHELAQLSIPDLLGVVARNALIVIPAERCVVFMYDKTTNLLSLQVSCSVSRLSGTSNDAAGQLSTPQEADEELSFPPVMGMVSACFLQRRCLRMQEPNLHKAFHRDYDVPKNLNTDSIIAAPVTLHHRTVGVIELVNRIDLDGRASGPPEYSMGEPVPRPAGCGAGAVEEEIEIQLTHTRAEQPRPRIGFSAKDEQKMIRFTSHVAQLLDNKLKLLAQVESAAKLREEQARTAMELLEMMNHKLELKPTVVPVPPPPMPRPRRPTACEFPSFPPSLPEDLLFVEPVASAPSAIESPLLKDLFGCADILKVMVGISRTQAIFRGNHLRKVNRLSQALSEHRVARRRVRSAVVIQRATRHFLARRWRKQRRNAVWTITRAVKSYHTRAALTKRIASKKKQQQQQQQRKPAVVSEIQPREGAHHKLVEAEVYEFRQRYASAMRIQQQFRGHRARKEIKKFTKGRNNIVKLQSLVRGTIARKSVQRIKEEKRTARAANIVCMRLAATESLLEAFPTSTTASERHHVLNSRDCVYLLPVLTTGAHVAANRAASYLLSPEMSTSPPYHFRQRRLFPAGELREQREDNSDSGLRPLSRPLAPSPLLSPRYQQLGTQPPPLADGKPIARAELARQFPSVVFDIDPKRAKRCPPGVQEADDWLSRRPQHRRSILRRNSDDDRQLEEPAPRCSELHSKSPHRRAFAGENAVSNQLSELLPRLVRPVPPLAFARSNRLQVCFVPAGTIRRKANLTRPASDVPPEQSIQPIVLPASAQRRPHTTR